MNGAVRHGGIERIFPMPGGTGAADPIPNLLKNG